MLAACTTLTELWELADEVHTAFARFLLAEL